MSGSEQLKAHYRQLSEWELLDIHSRSSTLTDEARAALSEVIAERKIDLQRLRQEEAHEERARAAAEDAKEKKRDRRDAFLFKWFLIIGLPIIAIGAFLRPDRAIEAFASALVQGIGLFVIAWLALKVKRRMGKK